MNYNNNVSFDASDSHFLDAQQAINNINENIETILGSLNTFDKNLKSIEEEKPVGFVTEDDDKIRKELELFSQNWTDILERANNIREIRDLINSGTIDEITKMFSNQESYFKFLTDVALGSTNLRVLLGNDLFSSVDYKEIADAGYTVQGYTTVEENGNSKILITAHSGGKGENARLYIYDKDTGKLDSVIVFNHNDHVGGISCDTKNGILWVAGDKGNIHSYNYDMLEKMIEEKRKGNDKTPTIDFNDEVTSYNLKKGNIEIPNDINVKNLLSSDSNLDKKSGKMISNGHYQNGMDSVYVHDGKIYSCSFGGSGELVETTPSYTKDSNGNITQINTNNNSKIVGKLNGSTQGIALYNENNKTYLISASSCFGAAKSRITKWEVQDNKITQLGNKYIEHPGLEGIEIEKGVVKGVFEYNNKATEVLGNVNDNWNEKDMLTDKTLSVGGTVWDTIHN